MREFPTEITPELREILGIPNFRCGPIASAFRAIDGYAIPPKAEEEQAFVLFWLLGLYLLHGAGWKKVAAEKLDQLVAASRKVAT